MDLTTYSQYTASVVLSQAETGNWTLSGNSNIIDNLNEWRGGSKNFLGVGTPSGSSSELKIKIDDSIHTITIDHPLYKFDDTHYDILDVFNQKIIRFVSEDFSLLDYPVEESINIDFEIGSGSHTIEILDSDMVPSKLSARIVKNINKIPFIHLKCSIPPTLSMLGDISNMFVFVPDDSFLRYSVASGWNNLYNASDYTRLSTLYVESKTKHGNRHIYDGKSKYALYTNENLLWPESMMYWLGYGKISYELENSNPKYIIEPEDYFDQSKEIGDILTVGDIDKAVLERKTPTGFDPTGDAKIINDNNILDYFQYIVNNDPYQRNMMFEWMLSEITTLKPGNVTIPNVTKTSLTDFEVLRKCTGITSLPSDSFNGWDNLTKLLLPPNISSIGDRSLKGIGEIDKLNIPSPTTSIGLNAFDGTIPSKILLTNFANYLNISFNDPKAVPTNDLSGSYCPKLYIVSDITLSPTNTQEISGNITIPSTITTIKPYALYNYQHSTSYIMTSILSIGSKAFYGNSNLSSISIQSACANIASDAFEGCNNLTTININSNSIINNESKLKSMFGPQVTTYNLGNAITTINALKLYSENINNSTISLGTSSNILSIGFAAFCGNKGTNIIPNTNPIVGKCAYDHCSGITTTVNQTNIDYMTYMNCSNLSSINLSNVENIGSFAFFDCENLSTVNIGSDINVIGDYAFARRSSQSNRTVNIYATTPPSISSSTFADGYQTTTYYNTTIHVLSEALSDYQNDENWSKLNIMGDLTI